MEAKFFEVVKQRAVSPLSSMNLRTLASFSSISDLVTFNNSP